MSALPAHPAGRRGALRRLGASGLGIGLGLAGAGVAAPSRAQAGPPVDSAPLRVQPVAQGLVHPWGLACLPDGRLLVSERPGRLRLLTPEGTAARVGPPLAGLPPVAAVGQGGLLDVALSPGFAEDRWVCWSYAEPAAGGANATAVARGRLLGPAGAERLAEVQVIFRQQPAVASRLHFGSRLAFGHDGRLFVTLGDRYERADDAQRLDNLLGKIVRLEPDGRVRPTTRWSAAATCRPAPGQRSGAGATATCRAPRCTRAPARCGPPSTARRAATSSTASAAAATTAGR